MERTRDPTRKEIAAACLAIQATWTDAIRNQRYDTAHGIDRKNECRERNVTLIRWSEIDAATEDWASGWGDIFDSHSPKD